MFTLYLIAVVVCLLLLTLYIYYCKPLESVLVVDILVMFIISLIPGLNVIACIIVTWEILTEGFSNFLNYLEYHDDKFTRTLGNFSKSIKRVLLTEITKPRR